jgi:hypothetical protein
MVSDVEPMFFPSKDVGGEFVGMIFITGLLPKLNASRKDPNGVQLQGKLHKSG